MISGFRPSTEASDSLAGVPGANMQSMLRSGQVALEAIANRKMAKERANAIRKTGELQAQAMAPSGWDIASDLVGTFAPMAGKAFAGSSSLTDKVNSSWNGDTSSYWDSSAGFGSGFDMGKSFTKGFGSWS